MDYSFIFCAVPPAAHCVCFAHGRAFYSALMSLPIVQLAESARDLKVSASVPKNPPLTNYSDAINVNQCVCLPGSFAVGGKSNLFVYYHIGAVFGAGQLQIIYQLVHSNHLTVAY